MPSVDASKSVLSSGAGYQAGDWADVGAQASLDVQAVADFSRGFDVQLGAEAVVSLDGAIREFLAADVQGEAHAAARVRAQVQVPLDLFNEAGLAVRLQAIAEASAGVTLAVGLQVGDFLQMAADDDRMRGVPLELLKAFLAEFTIQGGVMAKAAAAAMAYANLAMTGRLVPKGNEKVGFTVAAEAGVGLKAGAGFRVLARFGVDDPRRWLRRSIDIAVDETIRTLRPSLPRQAAGVLEQVRVPAKIALRTAFEVGSALADNQGAYAAGDGPKLSLRCVQVALEEVQRHVFEEAVASAIAAVRIELHNLVTADRQRWHGALAQRQAVAATLDAMPEYRFEATQENLDYWVGLIGQVAQLALALVPAGTVPAEMARPLSIAWSAVQLGSITLKRVTVGEARLSLLGQPTAQAVTAFDGSLPSPPTFIRHHINASLGRNAGAAVAQRQAVAFLVTSLVENLEDLDPGVEDAIRLVAGAHTDSVSEGLSIVLYNIGAFVPDTNGTARATTSLMVVRDALSAFVDGRIESELRPALLDPAGDSRETALFADEVLLGSLRTIVRVLLDRILAWDSGDAVSQRAVRELCSSLVMGLAGRTLVVCSDVLMTKALESMQGELRELADHVDDPSGIAPVLAGLTGLDRDFVAEVVEETLLVCADAFEPMPAERRARLRALLYEVIDSGAGLSITDLQRTDFVPNQSAAQELAVLLGAEIAGNVVRFVEAFLARVGMLVLQALQELIRELQETVEQWIAGLVGLVHELGQRLARLAAEVDALGRQLEQAGDDLLERLSSLLNRLSDHSGSRTALRQAARDIVTDEALGVLRSIDLYKRLPPEVKTTARDELRKAVGAVLDTGIFDFVLDGVAAMAGETADFLDDIRAIEPGDDVEHAVLELFLDRLEDAIFDAVGGDDPGIDLAIDIPYVVHISLGRVEIPLAGLITEIRRTARNLQGIKNRVRDVAEQLVLMFEKEAGLVAADAESQTVRDEQTRAEAHLAQSRRGQPTMEVRQPVPGAALRGTVRLDFIIRNVTRALLDTAPPAQQRLFLWVNQDLVALDAAEVRDFGSPVPTLTPVGTVPFDVTLHDRIGPLAKARDRRGGAPRAAGKGQGFTVGSNARKRGVARAQTTRLGGRGVQPPPTKASPSSIGRNVRTTELRGEIVDTQAAIGLSLAIPQQHFAEGINTITLAVMTGGSEQRVEHTVSFLWRPPLPIDGPRLTMPRELTWDSDALPSFARDRLNQRFGAGRVVSAPSVHLSVRPRVAPLPLRAWAVAQDRKGVLRSAWFQTRAVRAEALHASRTELLAQMRTSVREIERMREAVSKGALRPRRVDPPASAPVKDAGKGASHE